MKFTFKKVSLGFIIIFLLMGFGLPKNIQKKVDKEIAAYFDIDTFTMEAVSVLKNNKLDLPSKFDGENLLRVFDGKSPVGYVYVEQAPSKTANFDYMILLDNNFKILHSKVLIYREEYGGEIGSKRWLKQFNGKMPGDRVDHESNIDGIAGATISVRSMTNAIDDLLQSLSILKKHKVL
ncbi:FMN-binding protein [Maribacter hydrothermalis]|uniref:FMN-binding protein n=1 Tax=Maribacter hydrothermalis TaxID=1836467 RepID=A0A1B7Z1M6_9FLAO|nr:FMN-binding protein [Maribacter hydrothermalis]APQ18242.1 FMN-binding protein [Maribacter hydrothermalis]OBR36588.1 FMN-binding protein [Maribacter hydrothermalis]